jgi:heptosyltransferase II
MGLSTLQALLNLYPRAQIYYALPAWIVPLFKSYTHPRVSFVPLKLANPIELLETYLLIRQFKIDAIYEMHVSGRSKRFFSWMSFLSKIPYGYHNHHLRSQTGVRDQGVIKPLIQRDLDGAQSFFLGNESTIRPWNYLDFQPHYNLVQKLRPKKRVILGVVATRETKMYPLSSYLQFAKSLIHQDSEIEVVVPLSLSQDDQNIKTQLQKEDNAAYIKIIHLPLKDLPSYFAESWSYVGNDTGLKHLAIAVGLRTYTLFGPEPPLEWHPYDRVQHPYYFREPLECRTRTHHYCGLKNCDSMICLNELRSTELLENFQQMYK